MLKFGFYQDPFEIKELIPPLIDILDGSKDVTTVEEEKKIEKKLEEINKENDDEKEIKEIKKKSMFLVLCIFIILKNRLKNNEIIFFF